MALIEQLPPEVFSQCFVFLPLRDRIVATHVSRAWRVSALAAPEVWSDIKISSTMKSPDKILAFALKHVGRLPVNLRVIQYQPHDLDQERVTRVLRPHMHHIRSIDWGYNSRATRLLDRSAPALESFRQIGLSNYLLTPKFFGGKVGNLRRLHLQAVSLSDACPAVATVTDLRIESTGDGLFHLFSLFPSLHSLALLRITKGHALILRDMRPPQTLSVLELESVARNVDLLGLYHCWSNEHLTDVTLFTERPPGGLHLTRFISDVLTLRVELGAGEVARIVSLDSRARRWMLMLYCSRDGGIIAKGFDGAQGCLTHLHSLTISVTLLYKLSLRGLFVPPALKDLTLVIDQEQEHPNEGATVQYRYHWPWNELGKLSAFVHSLGIEALTLEMRCMGLARPPTLEDGRTLMYTYIPQLVRPDARPALRIRVRGLPHDVADGLAAEMRALQLDWDRVGIIAHSPFETWSLDC